MNVYIGVFLLRVTTLKLTLSTTSDLTTTLLYLLKLVRSYRPIPGNSTDVKHAKITS